MCGIHAVIALVDKTAKNADSTNNVNGNDSTAQARAIDDLPEVLHSRLARRGPDHFGQVQSSSPSVSGNGKHAILRFTSTVLALRGDGLTAQPFEDAATGRVLCWNGEVWKMGSGGGDDEKEVNGNDGQELFDRLTASSNGAAVLTVLRAIEGPFAFVYYDRPAGRLYYGRDRLGRRSLLVKRTDDSLTLSSVSDVPSSSPSTSDAPWTEVEADGIYVVGLQHDLPFASASSSDGAVGGGGGTTRYDWSDQLTGDGTDVVSGLGRFNMAADPPPEESRLTIDSPSVHELREQLTASLRLRVRNVPRPPRQPSDSLSPNAVDTRIAVLFSGGLDCTVLARMVHDLLPADQGVDLINVAFENPRVAAHLRDGDRKDVYEACPDRVTGRASLAELQRTCPQRAWRFLAVNVPYTETVAHRPAIVALMHPHNTEMDLSIASALYFASRGVSSEVSTHARVLLSGLGADELFGGYGRHAIAFSRDNGGYAALASELLLDVARLGRRNLGRDDRVLAHWGREVRFPFLDEALVRWALALPAWAKCDFANPTDEGDADSVEPAKRVLRLVALSLGMPGVAREKKRAVSDPPPTMKKIRRH